jgi:hypothetical protein
MVSPQGATPAIDDRGHRRKTGEEPIPKRDRLSAGADPLFHDGGTLEKSPQPRRAGDATTSPE